MRKFKLIFVFLLAIFMFNGKAFAASAKLSVSTNEVFANEGFKVMVDMSSAAAWDIHVTAFGPVEGCTINQSNASADGTDEDHLFIANCIATEEGTIKLVLNGDIKAAEMKDASEISDTVSVNVKKEVIELPAVQEPEEQVIDTPQVPVTDNTAINEKKEEKIEVKEEPKEEPKPVVKSDNNNVRTVIINGVEIQKNAEGIYATNVKKSVATANVEILPEDEKATVEVRGVYNLNVGNNSFDATITSESGIKNIIKLKITRANVYEIDELETVLNDNNITDKEISIKDNMIFNEEILNIIKNSNKLVYFNYIENNKILYRWILDGSKINNKGIFTAEIELSSDDKDNVKEKLNADDMIKIISSDESEELEGIKLYVYVGNKFKTGDNLKIYIKDKYHDEYSILYENVAVQNGYITFDVNKKQNFYIVKEKTVTAPVVVNTKKENNSILDNKMLIIGAGGVLLIIVILVIVLLSKKKNKKGNDSAKEMPTQPIVNVDTNSVKKMPMQQATTSEVNNVVQPVTTPEISNTQPAVTTDFNVINQTTQPVVAPSFNEINQNTQPVLNQNNVAAEFSQPANSNNEVVENLEIEQPNNMVTNGSVDVQNYFNDNMQYFANPVNPEIAANSAPIEYTNNVNNQNNNIDGQ